MRDQVSPWITATLMLVIVVATLAGLYSLVGRGSKLPTEVGLPLLAIGGVVVLLVSLALVSAAFAVFNLSDKTQALGLPEGSIRAVIAISLVVLFAILSIFLYSSMRGGQLKPVANLTEQQRDEFLKATPVTQVAAITSAGAGTDQRFTIYYRDQNQASEDFAKQLLVMIGTLVTSVASFYFGSKVASSGQVTDGTRSPPSIRSVSPKTHSRDGALFLFEITGDNLDLVKEAKIVQGGKQVVTSDVTSNASLVRCQLKLTPDLPEGTWDVIVTDGTGRQAKLPAVLTVT